MEKSFAENTEKKEYADCPSRHILACLSTSPSNPKIIGEAAEIAHALNAEFTALFVETPDFAAQTAENKRRLRENAAFAEKLGAKIRTVYGDDIALQIAEFARLAGVTKIVLGSSLSESTGLFGEYILSRRIAAQIPEIDIYIIPDNSVLNFYKPRKLRDYNLKSVLRNTVYSVGILSAATLCGWIFRNLGFTNANIMMVYILAVLLTSVATSHRIYSLISSIASVFVFNFLFTEPVFTLAAYEAGYPVTFAVMFATAYITGTFAVNYKRQAKHSSQIAERTKILFDTDRLLSRAGNKDEILQAAARQTVKLLQRNIVIFENENGKLSNPVTYGPNRDCAIDTEKERKTAQWVLENNHFAGAMTDIMSDAEYMYFALRVTQRVYGVVGVQIKNNPIDAWQHGILLSILGECALALENEKNAREKEAAAILAESEQLRANMLRTISHDLRTPLTAISGNASNLLYNSQSFDEQTKKQIYSDIYDDSMWLIDLVENLLYATRIEQGRMSLNTSAELLGDIVEDALRHCVKKSAQHNITTDFQDDMLLVKADARLLAQVIVNIVDNAVKYTAPGSTITISARKQGKTAVVEIADNGNGIPDSEKEKIFDRFYCGNNTVADNRRSIGLGLYLCRSIINAHGGEIWVRDNLPSGAVFGFSLPLEEINLYE